MCEFLKVQRSLVYYHLSKEPYNPCNEEAIIINHIKDIFKRSRNNYGTRKIKVYTTNCNESPILNLVDREFDNREKLEAAVSDLTYVRVADKWNYVCILIDLYNREIIGYSAGAKKDAKLIETALLRCKYSLKDIKVFHSDRGNCGRI